MNEENKKKEEQKLTDKKFEDFIQGIYDTDKEPSNEDWLDNVASAMVPNEADKEKCSEVYYNYQGYQGGITMSNMQIGQTPVKLVVNQPLVMTTSKDYASWHSGYSFSAYS